MGIISHIAGLVSMRRDESYLFWKNVLKVAPRQLNLYEKALIHASKMPKVGENNERLEFLGDAVLDMVVADLLYEAYPMDSEGELTKKRTELVKRRNLNVVAENIGLTSRLMCGGAVQGDDLGGNALEAVVGALYKDRGYQACKKFIKQTIFCSQPQKETLTESKQKLAVWCQKNKKELEYKLLKDERLADNKHIFLVAVEVDGVEISQAVGSNKKNAQRKAAELALKRLRRKHQSA